jgi:hypothetical protein
VTFPSAAAPDYGVHLSAWFRPVAHPAADISDQAVHSVAVAFSERGAAERAARSANCAGSAAQHWAGTTRDPAQQAAQRPAGRGGRSRQRDRSPGDQDEFTHGVSSFFRREDRENPSPLS